MRPAPAERHCNVGKQAREAEASQIKKPALLSYTSPPSIKVNEANKIGYQYKTNSKKEKTPPAPMLIPAEAAQETK